MWPSSPDALDKKKKLPSTSGSVQRMFWFNSLTICVFVCLYIDKYRLHVQLNIWRKKERKGDWRSYLYGEKDGTLAFLKKIKLKKSQKLFGSWAAANSTPLWNRAAWHGSHCPRSARRAVSPNSMCSECKRRWILRTW